MVNFQIGWLLLLCAADSFNDFYEFWHLHHRRWNSIWQTCGRTFFCYTLAIQKSIVIQTLTQLKAKLSLQFGVSRLALFGSTAHDTSNNNSDIDILVSFDGIATSQRYFGKRVNCWIMWLHLIPQQQNTHVLKMWYIIRLNALLDNYSCNKSLQTI